MSTTGIIIGLLMVGISLAWLGLPFIRRSATSREQSVQQLEQLAAYERILAAVRDLDEDYQVGKLANEQYAAERAQWLDRGAAVLEALEKLAGQPSSTKPIRTSSAQPDTTSQDDPVEQAIAAYARAREQQAAD